MKELLTGVSGRIKADRLANEQRIQDMCTFSVYHIMENGAEHYFECDLPMELMQTSWHLLRYQRGELETKHECFAASFRDTTLINAQKFEEHVRTRMCNTGKITGVFDIDFDMQEISGVHIMDGWKTYSMKDASTAADHAYRADYLSVDQRWNRFCEYLDGRELTPEQGTQMMTMQ